LISRLILRLKRNQSFSKDLLKKFAELEKRLNYSFKEKKLLAQSLKHRSFIAQNNDARNNSNERLEFLGDSVLNFTVSRHLFKLFPGKSEGELSKMRSVLVSGENLIEIARKLSLGNYILISDYEEKSGGRDKDSLLEDCLEAIIGAIYLDAGIIRTQKFIKEILLDNIDTVLSDKKNTNFKSELLELVQSYGFDPPAYEIIKEDGPEHDKIFTVNVNINGNIVAEGRSNSKKRAEQEASSNALGIIKMNPKYLNKLKKQ